MVDMFWSSSCGRIELQFKDIEQVLSMAHSGDCKESVKAQIPYFLPQLQTLDRARILSVLSEMFFDECQNEIVVEGCTSNLDQLSDEDLHVKLLWIAAWDKHDEYNMDELCKWQNQFLAEREREKHGE